MGKTTLLPATAALLFLIACSGDPASSITSSVASPAIMSAAANASGGLTLHPNGFGHDAYAAWKAGEGEADSHGNARHALYFQKFTATEEPVAGVARINGLEGQPLSAIQSLSWERKIEGYCGAGAPRWDIIVADANGNRGVIFLGCAGTLKGAAQESPRWIKDIQPGPIGIAAAPIFAFGPPLDLAGGLTISELLIVFDEGTSQFGLPAGPGFVYLDNIEVNGKIWTSPADNGRD